MIKRILVPLDPSSYSDMAVEYACRIAKKYDAEITGLVILDIPGIIYSEGMVPLGALTYAEQAIEYKEGEAQKKIEVLLKAFKERCMKEGVKHREAEGQGSPADQILHQAVYYDILIIGLRTFFNFETAEKPIGASVEDILDHSATPVLAVPQILPVKSEQMIKTVICFDGSNSSITALHRFVQLMNPDETKITLLISKDDKKDADILLDNAEAFLRSHQFIHIEKKWTGLNIINEIENEYINNTDLFVIGAHSKNILSAFKIGSLTRYLIKEDKVPVLIGV